MNETSQERRIEFYRKANDETLQGLDLAIRIARYLLKHATIQPNIRKKADEELTRLERDVLPPF